MIMTNSKALIRVTASVLLNLRVPYDTRLNLLSLQKELISGDQNGNIRVWDLAANSCSCELVRTYVLI